MANPSTKARPTLSSIDEITFWAKATLLQKIEKRIRDSSLLLLVTALAFAMFWPGLATSVLAPRALLTIPHTSFAYEPRTIALALIVFSASLRCRPSQFVGVLTSRSGLANLVAVYVAVPLVTLAVAALTLRFGSEDLRFVAMGLVLATLMPVAMTSTVWTRASRGNVSLALGTLALTSACAVFLIPFAIEHLPAPLGSPTVISIGAVRSQVILAFAVPLVLGLAMRGVMPRVASKLDPIFSLASFVALLLSVADCAGVLRPHLTLHSPTLFAALLVTIVANSLSFGAGYFVGRLRGMPEEDSIALVFSSGMRSTPAAMIVGAIAFPTTPLATLVPILWSVTQQLLAGVLTRQLLKKQLARRSTQHAQPAAARLPVLSEPMPALLEQSLVLPLVRRFETTLSDTPYEELFETLVYRPPPRRRSELSNVIARRELG